MTKKLSLKTTNTQLQKLVTLDEKVKSIQKEQEKIKSDLTSFLTSFLLERGALQTDFTTLLGALDNAMNTLKNDPLSHEKFKEIGTKLLKK